MGMQGDFEKFIKSLDEQSLFMLEDEIDVEIQSR
jgi:hypothetical protein